MVIPAPLEQFGLRAHLRSKIPARRSTPLDHNLIGDWIMGVNKERDKVAQ